jgi:uncharacterized protein
MPALNEGYTSLLRNILFAFCAYLPGKDSPTLVKWFFSGILNTDFPYFSNNYYKTQAHQNQQMVNELSSFWNRIFSFNWKFGLLLTLLVCIPRFILVLHANVTGSYALIGLIMTLYAIVPFLFLNKYGRKAIGITRPKKSILLFTAFFCGLLASILLYLLGDLLYGNTYENWYAHIGKSYKIPENIGENDKALLFAIMALTGMTFSPIGEELFFRGIVHSSFAKSIGDQKASIADGSAFALTHISHFGLVFVGNQWEFFLIPTLIWVTSMFLLSLMFFAFRNSSGSILGAIICHSAFNLGMIYCIFYLM